MCANGQPDGRPAKYRWRPLFNTAVWLTATTRVPCSNTDKKSKPLKLAGVHQTNEMISAARGPKFTILWKYVEEVLLLEFLVTFWVLHFQQATCSTFHNMHFKFALRPHHVWKHGRHPIHEDENIMSASARKKPQGKNIMACPIP